MISAKHRYTLVTLLLTLGVLFQTSYLLRNASRDLERIARSIGQTALWRGAKFNQGQRFANYVQFLHQNVPEDGRVVLPLAGVGPRALGFTPFMQFFLAPREVINCSDFDCLRNLSREDTYILVVGEFPGGGYFPQDQLMFDESWGVILSENQNHAEGSSMTGFQTAAEVLYAALWPFLWLALLTVSGSLLVSCFIPAWDVVTKLALGYGLGLGVFTLTIGMMSLVGVGLDPGVILGTTVLLFLVSLGAFVVCRRRRISGGSTSRSGVFITPRFDFWQAALLGLGFLSVLISVGKGYHVTDGIQLWGVKGLKIAYSGSLATVTQWGTNTAKYPLNIPILIASLQVMFDEILPASKIIFSGFYTTLMLVIYSTLVRSNLRRSTAGLATLLLATVPFVFRHSTIGYANMALSYYVVSAVILLAGSLRLPALGESDGTLLLSGLFFAGAAWTRPEGLMISWFVIVLVLIAAFLKKDIQLSLRIVIPLLIPLGVYSVYWLFLKGLIYDQQLGSDLVTPALAQISHGNLHIAEALFILRSTFSHIMRIKVWGVVGFGIIIALILSLVPILRRKSHWVVFVSGLVYMLAILGFYFLASFDTVHDISWWVNTGLDRMLLPGFLLIWIWGISWIEHLYDCEDRSISTGLE
jgi:hypothetical protein